MSRKRVVLHVGTPKSGTTYLQGLLWESRAPLADAGVRYPGEAPDDHFLATVELLEGHFHGHRHPRVDGAWSRLCAAVHEHAGTTVVSHELLGDLTDEGVARIVAELRDVELHVVVTARDLARQLPAVWQEDVKNRHSLPFADFLAIVRPGSGVSDVSRPIGGGSEEGHGEAFWMRQDVGALLRRWARHVPAEQLHLVTVPPAGAEPGLLWQRFAGVLGVDPEIAVVPEGRRNMSLGSTETELLRRLNARLDYGVEWPVYGPRVTHHLATDSLVHRTGSVRLRLPDDARTWVCARADRMVAEIEAVGPTVTGALTELRVQDRAAGGVPHEPSAEELLGAALDALAGLLAAEVAPEPEPPAPELPTPDSELLASEPDLLQPDLLEPDILVPESRAVPEPRAPQALPLRLPLPLPETLVLDVDDLRPAPLGSEVAASPRSRAARWLPKAAALLARRPPAEVEHGISLV